MENKNTTKNKLYVSNHAIRHIKIIKSRTFLLLNSLKNIALQYVLLLSLFLFLHKISSGGAAFLIHGYLYAYSVFRNDIVRKYLKESFLIKNFELSPTF